MNQKRLEHFARSMRSDIFASRPKPSDGIDYAHEVIESMPKEMKIYAYTALYVCINSISDELLRIANDTDQAGADQQDAGAELRTSDSGVPNGQQAEETQG